MPGLQDAVVETVDSIIIVVPTLKRWGTNRFKYVNPLLKVIYLGATRYHKINLKTVVYHLKIHYSVVIPPYTGSASTHAHLFADDSS